MKRVLASLGLALWATGLLAQSESNEFGLKLVQPAGTTSWTAGTVERIKILIDPKLAAARGVHEWEAFLSLDGGKQFSIRLTPHLDLDRLETTFVVPDVPTDDARLLLRVGDEEREHEIEVATRYRIEPAPATPRALVVSRPVAHGESARVGAPGVIEWVEGVGAAQRRVVAAAPTRSMRSDAHWSALRAFDPFLHSKPRPLLVAAGSSLLLGWNEPGAQLIVARDGTREFSSVSLSKVARRNE